MRWVRARILKQDERPDIGILGLLVHSVPRHKVQQCYHHLLCNQDNREGQSTAHNSRCDLNRLWIRNPDKIAPPSDYLLYGTPHRKRSAASADFSHY
jgi:hypothetical protein